MQPTSIFKSPQTLAIGNYIGLKQSLWCWQWHVNTVFPLSCGVHWFTSVHCLAANSRWNLLRCGIVLLWILVRKGLWFSFWLRKYGIKIYKDVWHASTLKKFSP